MRMPAVASRSASSTRPLDVAVTAKATAAGAAVPVLDPRTVSLAPGVAREVAWELTVPAATTKLGWQVDATEREVPAGVQGVRDALAVSQRVVPAVPERTYQATIFQLTEPQAVPVERPADALPGRGGVNVQVQATLAGELPGVRDWLARYPYTCFEQRASAAIWTPCRFDISAMVSPSGSSITTLKWTGSNIHKLPSWSCPTRAGCSVSMRATRSAGLAPPTAGALCAIRAATVAAATRHADRNLRAAPRGSALLASTLVVESGGNVASARMQPPGWDASTLSDFNMMASVFCISVPGQTTRAPGQSKPTLLVSVNSASGVQGERAEFGRHCRKWLTRVVP